MTTHSLSFGLARWLALTTTLWSGCSPASPLASRAVGGSAASPQTAPPVQAPMTMVHGAVYDASNGATPIAAGQVTPVYDCKAGCDLSQAVPGVDTTQTVALADGEFLFLQRDARLTGYFIDVPGYQPLFVPRSFRNPAPPVVYRPAALDGGQPSEEENSEPGVEVELDAAVPLDDAPLDAAVPADEAPVRAATPEEPAESEELPVPDAGVDSQVDDGAWNETTWDMDAAVTASDAGTALADASVDASAASPDAGQPMTEETLPPVFLCPEGAADSDNDGVCDLAEMRYTTDASNEDTDGDFLSDAAELYGYRNEAGELLDLPKLNANPKHRDIFLYIDYYDGLGPATAATDQVVQAFANAAWTNVDGTPGIALHVTRAPQPIAADLVKRVIDFPELAVIKAASFPKLLTYAYHYVLFADRVLSETSTMSGMSPDTEVASDFIVSLGGWRPRGGTVLHQAGTLMHELGHNLGLDHGGYTYRTPSPAGPYTPDRTSFKPNYLSVMNYSYQSYGIIRDGKRVIDYSRNAVGPLSEQALNEAAALDPPDADSRTGLAAYTRLHICRRQANEDCSRFATIRRGTGASNLDWNRNRRIDKAAVRVDLNGLNSTRDSYDGIASDWGLLKFHGLPRPGDHARFVELGNLPARSCLSQPNAEEEEEDAEPEAP